MWNTFAKKTIVQPVGGGTKESIKIALQIAGSFDKPPKNSTLQSIHHVGLRTFVGNEFMSVVSFFQMVPFKKKKKTAFQIDFFTKLLMRM